MKVLLAKTAGFCFGVDRAVKLTYQLLAEGRKVATLGPLIHNPQVVADLAEKGALTCEDLDDVPDGYEVVIRSHGVPARVYEKINTRGLAFHDATCPFVSKIHKLAEEAGKNGALLLVAGDAKHPEVQGIVGHTTGPVLVFAGEEELAALRPKIAQHESITVVAQTTFQVQAWEKCKTALKKWCTNAQIFDTICNATWARQQEAEDLSQRCDHMIVIGGHHSSNTQKLLQVAARHTTAITVETADELDRTWLQGAETVGVTAGASTPSSIIEEVLNCMSEEIRDDMSFAEMLEASEAKPLFAGKIVKAKVISENGTIMEGDVMEANKGGVVVNVKGVRVFVPRSQATMRRDEDYTKLVGQHVRLYITECAGRKIVGSINKVTAEENKVKREEFWQNVEVGKHYAGVVKSLTSYGAFVDIGGVDGLCHISELSWQNIKHPSEVVKVGDSIDVYVKSYDPENQKVSLGYKKEEDNPWEQLKTDYPIGSEFVAPVVSITKFGAFVRILPGVDGLVHISEISNERVNKVSDVLKVGDEVRVKLINVDFERKRISLSMKACEGEQPMAEEASDEGDAE